MKRLLTTVVILGLWAGGAYADEATRQKLADPRYAEPTPKFTLKIAADVQSVQLSPEYPAYPMPPAAQPAPAHWPHWRTAVGLVLAVIGFAGWRLSKRRAGLPGE